MAFDIQRARGSLPGRSGAVPADFDVRTGAGQVVAATGQAGAAVQSVARTLNRLEAENQLAESQRQATELFDQLSLDFERNPDSSTYQQRFDEAMGQMQQFMPKNKLAARAFGNQIRDQRVAGKIMVQEAMLERERDTKRANIFTWTEQGQFDKARKAVISGLADGTIESETLGQKLLVDIDRKQDRRKAELIVLGDNPEAFLTKYKTAPQMMKDFPALNPGDFQDLKSMAKGQQRTIQIRDNEVVLSARTEASSDTWSAAADGDFSRAQQSILAAREELVGKKWKSDELAKITKASEIMAETGVNPYTERIDDPAYQIAWQRAVNGDISITEIDAGVGDQWTISDGEALKKIIAGETNKAQDQEQIQAFRDLSTLIGAADTFNAVPGAVQSAKIQGRKILEDEIASAETPLRGEELEMAMFRIVGEMKRRVETGFTPEQLLPTPGKEGTPGRFVESGGEIIGSIDDVGRLVLNINGVRRLFTIAGKSKARAREIAAERGFIIPGE